MSSLVLTTTCACNGNDYVTKSRLSTHRQSAKHRLWELTNKCNDLVCDVKRRDNKISALELAITNSREDAKSSSNRLEAYEKIMKMTLNTMKSHDVGEDTGKVSELEVKLAKSRETTDMMAKDLDKFKTMEQDFERFKTIAFLTGALDS